MILTAAMGSLCTAPRDDKHKERLPPTDLSELLSEAEKAGLPTPWLSEFQLHLASHDQKTGISWRARLLEFILEVRTILRLLKEGEKNKAEDLQRLILQLEERFFKEDEDEISLSDSGLRTKLISELKDYKRHWVGAQGTRHVLTGQTTSSSSIASLLQQVLMDPSVWFKMETLYSKWLQREPHLPLAVILSIL